MKQPEEHNLIAIRPNIHILLANRHDARHDVSWALEPPGGKTFEIHSATIFVVVVEKAPSLYWV